MKVAFDEEVNTEDWRHFGSLSYLILSYIFQLMKVAFDEEVNTEDWRHFGSYLILSYIFQLMKVGFDEEVNTEDVETLRKLTNKVRNPASVMNTFAFTGYILSQPSQLLAKHKEKNASLK